jgi:hypothetical protein
MLVPFLWSVSWLFYASVPEFVSRLRPYKTKLLLVPAIIPILAATGHRPGLAALLFLANAAGLALLAILRRIEIQFALGLALSSVIASLLVLPDSWAASLMIGGTRYQVVFALVAAIGIYLSVRNITAKGAVLGALSTAMLFLGTVNLEFGGIIALQASLVYFLAHSVRWPEPLEPGSKPARVIVIITWILHSFALQRHSEIWVTLLPSAAAAILLLCLLIPKSRRTLVIALAGVVVLIVKPIWIGVLWLRAAPDGLLALLASFALFAAGTLYALT